MNLDIPPELQEFGQTCRKLLEAHCPPELVREVATPKGDGHSESLWKALADNGWLGLPFAETLGGSGAGMVELGTVYRELGRAIVPTTFASTMFAALLIERIGTPEQVAHWIPRIAAGDVIATVAFSERDVERDPRCLRTTARRHPGGWLLAGTKAFVPNAARADLVVVAAQTADGAASELGFFLLTPPVDGLQIELQGTFSHDAQHVVRMDAVALDESALLGASGRLSLTVELHDEVRDAVTALQCMEMLGGAERVLELTCDYVRGRHQFGRAIGTFQAVQHHVANVGAAVAGGRLAALKALWLVGEGRPARRSVSIAKAWLNRAFVDASVLSHQLHGGMGYVLESDLHLWSQRAKSLEIQGGTSDVHLARVADILLNREFAALAVDPRSVPR